MSDSGLKICDNKDCKKQFNSNEQGLRLTDNDSSGYLQDNYGLHLSKLVGLDGSNNYHASGKDFCCKACFLKYISDELDFAYKSVGGEKK
jgi:hypothetical protein